MIYHCKGDGCKWFVKFEPANTNEAHKRHDYHVLQCHPKELHGKIELEAVRSHGAKEGKDGKS